MRLFASILLFFILSTPSWATTYYVRNDGGSYGTTSTTCNGQYDIAYTSGSPNGPNCAFNHPSQLLGVNGGTNRMASGDIMIIDNVDRSVGSGQGKYVVGITMPVHSSASCFDGADYSCQMGNIPAGISPTQKTKILGKGYENCDSTATSSKAQLWGQGRVSSVLNAAGDNIEIQCLEITDHSGCIENGPSDGTLASGDPVKCVRTGTYASDGDWATTGISMTSSLGHRNIIIKNVDVHGLAYKSVYLRRMGNTTITNSNFIGGGFVGWDSDANNGCTSSGNTFTIPSACSAHNDSNGTTDCVTTGNNANAQSCASCTADTANSCYWRRDDYTGEIILDNTRIQFNGCGEIYPRTSWDWDTTTDIHHCWSQDQGGFGDGIGLGDGPSGNWTLKNGSSVSWNTSDGIDLLHGSTGTLIMERSKAEGNAGQQFKSSVANTYIENSIINGNCGFFYGQSFTSTKDVSGSSVGFNNCRANGDTIAFSAGAGKKMYINNSTILSNGDSAIISSGSGCDGNTVLQMRNSIVLNGRQWGDDTAFNGAGGNDTTGFYYASGSDGAGSGTCGTLDIDEDYNIIYGAKTSTSQCTGAGSVHSICNQSPSFVTSFAMGPTTYQTTPNATSNFNINVGSPAVNMGLTTITTLQDGSWDFNNYVRGSQWDVGAIEYGTLATCSDGVFNGDETGLDCGGSCGTCPPIIATGSYLYNITPIGSIKFQ